jgi:HAD domain in Swiss Army Knife RNA repair proteins
LFPSEFNQSEFKVSKVIFLDIDGVLNSAAFMVQMARQGICPDDKIDPKAISILNRIIEEHDACLVISSTWRLFTTIDRLNVLLKSHGLRRDVFDFTYDYGGSYGRGVEISNWLGSHPEIDNCVVIDDDTVDVMDHRRVRTDFANGLQESHIELVRNMFAT